MQQTSWALIEQKIIYLDYMCKLVYLPITFLYLFLAICKFVSMHISLSLSIHLYFLAATCDIFPFYLCSFLKNNLPKHLLFS